MSYRITALLTMAVLMSISSLRADPPASGGKTANPDPVAVQTFIDRLGSSNFSERDQASKSLEAMGPAALPLLRLAKSTDQEVNVRLRRLVDKLEELALTASFVAPRTVHLKLTDVSVLEAVAELRRQSGQQIDVTGDMTGLARKITIDTGKAPIWEALHQLCIKGRLVEQAPVAFKNQQMNPYGNVRGQPQQNLNPSRSIVLVDGAASPAPVSFNGSIRVRALPANYSGNAASGEVNVVLEVVAEQRLEKFGIVDALFFDKSIDDQGQKLELLPEKPLDPLPNYNPNINRIVIINGVVQNGYGPPKPDFERTMLFRFKAGPKPAGTMKELSGKLILQALSPFEPLVTIQDVRKAAGKIAKGKDGHALHIDSVENIDKNGLRLKVTIESPPDPNMMQNPFAGNVVIMVNGNMGMPGSNTPVIYPKLVDANGKKYAPTVSNSRPVANGNGQVLHQATLVYRPEVEANQLVLEGQRTILFAVPVSLKDIPLR